MPTLTLFVESTPTGDASGVTYGAKASIAGPNNGAMSTATINTNPASEVLSFNFDPADALAEMPEGSTITSVRVAIHSTNTSTLAGFGYFVVGGVDFGFTGAEISLTPAALAEHQSSPNPDGWEALTAEVIRAGVTGTYQFVRDSGSGSHRVDAFALIVEFEEPVPTKPRARASRRANRACGPVASGGIRRRVLMRRAGYR